VLRFQQQRISVRCFFGDATLCPTCVSNSVTPRIESISIISLSRLHLQLRLLSTPLPGCHQYLPRLSLSDMARIATTLLRRVVQRRRNQTHSRPISDDTNLSLLFPMTTTTCFEPRHALSRMILHIYSLFHLPIPSLLFTTTPTTNQY